MTQEKFLGIVRHTLTFAGGLILVFVADADGVVQEVSASALMLAGVLWSIFTKTGQPLADKIRGVANHSIAIVSAILIYLGKDANLTTIETTVAMIINMIPFILSFLDKKD